MERIYKRVFFVWFNLKKMYRVNKLFFILVIISTMISTFGIFFFASYLAGYFFDSFLSQPGDMLIIDLEHSQMDGDDLLHVMEELGKDEMADIVCEQEQGYKQQEYNVMGEYHRNYSLRMQCGRLLEIEENFPNAVIDEWTAAAITSGDTPIHQYMEIDGKRYQVVGVCTMTDNDEVIVPVAYFLQNFKVSRIQIVFSGRLSVQKRNEKEMILKKYKINENDWKAMGKPWKNVDFLINFIQVLGVFIIIGINIFVLIYYLLYKCKRNYCVYSICGGTDREVFYIIISQNLVHLLIGIVLGTVLKEVILKAIGDVDWLYQGDFIFDLFLLFINILIHMIASYILGKIFIEKSEIYQIEE